jgi:hypothetical protein
MAGDHSIELWLPGPEWEGEDAFLIGGGPSLKEFDFTKLEGLNTIGCNDAYHLGPAIVQICLFSDRMWWERNKHALNTFQNRVVTNCAFLLHYNLPNILKMDRARDGLHGGTTLGWNFSTGASAIALAIRLGASRIFLLGYDLGNQGKVSHWHQHNTKVIREDSFQGFIRGFERVKRDLPAGVQVFNVTDGTSRLKCFQEITFTGLDSVLPAKEVS